MPCHALYTLKLEIVHCKICCFLSDGFPHVQVGYVSSWSAYATYVQKHPDRPDPLVQFREDYMKVFGFTSNDEKAKVTSPLFVILAKDPQPL